MHNRLGIYSGYLYSQKDFDNDSIKECCIMLNTSKKYTKDELDSLYNDKHKKCIGCHGCPRSMKGDHDE